MTGGDEVLRPLAWAAVPTAAAVLSAVLILWLRPLLQRYALARPNARSSHRQPTPQGGGIAVIAATIAVTAASVGLLGETMSTEGIQAWIVLAAAGLIAGVGGVDDLHPMPVAPRLVLQALAIAVAVAALPAEIRMVPLLPWWVERLGLLIGLLWFVNLVNFMDGIDWMTVVEVVPLAGAIALLGLLGMVPLTAPELLIALALVGATLGFAPFNKPVARLFLGDVGSLPIGLLLGWLLLGLAANGEIAAALLLPLYYLADATLTLLRRVAAGEPFWQAHRSHFYQRACDRGLSVADIVARVFATNLTLAGIAFVTVAEHNAIVATVSLAIGGALVAWLLVSLTGDKR
jgi:UDP-N-acetylmuramyl pentapeptide phosphotransferase/UDP-N-acetylglucosamine-1-phosphate transferase